jgi:DNA polymerase-3 subunit delta
VVYLVFGEDDYLVAAKAKDIVGSELKPEEQAFGLEIVDGKVDTSAEATNAVSQCIEALMTVGLFDSRKLVWFRDVSFLSDNQVGKTEAVKEQVNRLAERIRSGLADGQTLVVSAPKVDKRYAFYKAAKDKGKLFEYALPEKSYQAEDAARERLGELLPKLGLRMSDEVASAFLGKVGTDTRRIANELQKLRTYIGRDGSVSVADVTQIVCASRSAIAWDLFDAVGARDLPSALAVLRQLLFQKESPIGIVMGLEGRLRDLSLLRDAMDRGWVELARGGRGASLKWGSLSARADAALSELDRDPRKLHPFYAGKLAAQAARFAASDLRRAMALVSGAHRKMVTTSLPEKMVLELLLVEMLS